MTVLLKNLMVKYLNHLKSRLEATVIDDKRIVVLVVPAAEEIPTAFKEKRYIRIGSSKVNLKDYPRREIQLFKILDGRMETIETVTAKYQELTFSKLFGYYCILRSLTEH